MLDIKFIRANRAEVEQVAESKNIILDLDELLKLDDERRELLFAGDKLRERRNEIAEKLKDPILRTEEVMEEGKKIKAELVDIDAKEKEVAEKLQALMYQVPNIVSSDTPVGSDESGNKEIKKWGDLPKFDFPVKDHIELGLGLDWFDLERGAEISGFRGYFLKNELVRIQFALMLLALNKLIAKGFTPMITPTLAKESTLYGSGHFPWGKQESYHLAEDDLYLLGTAEPALASYYANTVFEEKDLPIKLVGFSPCYRREIGSYGKDTRGIYRVHEFWKVEQFVFDVADMAKALETQSMLQAQGEEILQDLELPYRVLQMCTGDMGEPHYRKFDTEAWIPSRNGYGELQSNSIMTDFQARRLNIRYKTKDGEIKYVYMFNDTALASPRILIPLLENHQTKDGKINLPKALQKYL